MLDFQGAAVIGVESIIIMLIVGAIAGWLAGKIIRGFGFGLIWNIVIGIIGALHRRLAVELAARHHPVPRFRRFNRQSRRLAAIVLLFIIGLGAKGRGLKAGSLPAIVAAHNSGLERDFGPRSEHP